MSFRDEIINEYEAEVERTSDGDIEIVQIDFGFHESILDDIFDHAAEIFADCPEEPGVYLCESSYTFRYNGRHTATAATGFQRLEATA